LALLALTTLILPLQGLAALVFGPACRIRQANLPAVVVAPDGAGAAQGLRLAGSGAAADISHGEEDKGKGTVGLGKGDRRRARWW